MIDTDRYRKDGLVAWVIGGIVHYIITLSPSVVLPIIIFNH